MARVYPIALFTFQRLSGFVDPGFGLPAARFGVSLGPMAPDVSFKPALLWWEGEFRDDLALRVTAEGTVLDAFVDASSEATPLPGRALLPGLVNCHSHAFQRLLRGRTQFVASGREGDDFWSWREAMYEVAGALGPDELYVAARQAFVEMALAGVTAVGEFHYLHHTPDGRPYEDPNELAKQVVRAARDVGLRICLLRAGYARSGFGLPENPRQRRFIEKDPGTLVARAEELARAFAGDPLVAVGLAPHSVRAAPRDWLAEVAKVRGRVVHMHVSEQPAEVDSCQREHGKPPVELLEELGLLGPHFTAVHAIHLGEKEVETLGRSKAFVCACPSTERDLGDGVLPADRLLGAGARVCLGSDSQVSVDLLDEARLLEGHLRLVRKRRAVLDPGGGEVAGLARVLLDSLTRNGADSLGLSSGALEPGRPADFFTVDLGHPSLAGADAGTLLPALLFGASAAVVREVAVGGKLIVKEGQHALEGESGLAFSTLSGQLFRG